MQRAVYVLGVLLLASVHRLHADDGGIINSMEALPRPAGEKLTAQLVGGNDWSSGMRGPLFEQTCIAAIDAIGRATDAGADVLPLHHLPECGTLGHDG